MNDVLDFLFDHSGLVLAALIAIVVGLLFLAAEEEGAQRDKFMAECRQHRENYECVAMWRAGEANDTYIPVVIPIR